jgi:hypothetical protein
MDHHEAWMYVMGKQGHLSAGVDCARGSCMMMSNRYTSSERCFISVLVMENHETTTSHIHGRNAHEMPSSIVL